ncbi:flagellar assembly peptidoglycan hydrolase FlgJ [Bordetella sp. 02P26C-1]|uniref:flagellar assembly peptidoglycan hydrolase FlgJ n=1 Tax=Bordetella sp. 02P26C-1 TaxID=2683195 RepID=UPI0013531BE2|nr:flagellar assembly peptidoglycan hydrolase FlgJ [Bordetella sp. 02P26C-1]MVW78189.1 flagellar assembly peptidoglycan hydrolase FlgJ [Bordetella sp. 02P26C-1]
MSFTPYTPRPGTAGRGASFVFDTSTLDKIKKGLSDDPSANSKESELAVARQFEALFIQQLLKQARQSSLDSGLWNSDQTKMIQSMGDEQMALELASGQGMGLSAALVELMNVNKPQASGESKPVDPVVGKSTRLPQHRSSMPLDGPNVAGSISELLDLLENGVQKTVSTAKRIVSRIEPVQDAADKVSAFVRRMGDAAAAVAQKSGIHTELILSQAALESGWGQREIRSENGQPSHNLFGIKATGNWNGKVVHVTTTEFVDGVPRKVVQPFRAYDSYEESLHDYARLLTENPRYEAVKQAPNAQRAAIEVQKAGYATDPQYAEKLIGIMAYFKPTQ